METKEVLANLRTQNGLTQDEMADRLFVTRQAVSRWENGNTTPNPDTLKLISKEFKISINNLLGGEEAAICQSCGMSLRTAEDLGSEGDGGINTEYCAHCYQSGAFSNEHSVDEMVESNLRFLKEFNKENGSNYSEEEAQTILRMHLATLKRWKN